METTENAVDTAPIEKNFADMVSESKAKIADAPKAPDIPARKAGRPAKPGAPSKYMEKKSRAQANGSHTEPEMGPPPPPLKVDLAPFLKTPIQVISKIPASKYQCADLAFSDDEAKACAESLNQIVEAFIPDLNQMDPKTAAVVSGLSVFGSIAFQKYSIYQQKRAEMLAKIVETEAQNQTIAAESLDSSPGAYFKTVKA